MMTEKEMYAWVRGLEENYIRMDAELTLRQGTIQTHDTALEELKQKQDHLGYELKAAMTLLENAPLWTEGAKAGKRADGNWNIAIRVGIAAFVGAGAASFFGFFDVLNGWLTGKSGP